MPLPAFRPSRLRILALTGLALLLATRATHAEPSQSLRPDLSDTDRARVEAITTPATDFSRAEPFEDNPGGAATSRKAGNRNVLTHPSANMTAQDMLDFRLGSALFDKLWTSSPSSTQASDGLGPLFNARACQSCHVRDGRGNPPLPGDRAVSLVLRLSIPPQTDEDRQKLADKTLLSIPEPSYGHQLQGFAVVGLAGEAQLAIETRDIEIELGGGETATLQAPTYHLEKLAYGPLHPQTMLSPRVTPAMTGLGLLEAIHPTDILALADPQDADGDGISGKPSFVRDPETGALVLGRFGWKAGNPTIRAQAADAFSNDIGISTPLKPDAYGDCTPAQSACRTLPDGVQARLGDTEAPDPILDLVAFYSAHLAVPARRNVSDPQVLEGKRAFHESGCIACHRPKFVTSREAEREEHRFQLIWPYTDLLLHDMGEGLADHRPDGDANGREWRTPPLWGIGLTQTANGHTRYLHDGRARNLLEAVLWHGGEAQAARDKVVAMQPATREALIAFLKSL